MSRYLNFLFFLLVLSLVSCSKCGTSKDVFNIEYFSSEDRIGLFNIQMNSCNIIMSFLNDETVNIRLYNEDFDKLSTTKYFIDGKHIIFSNLDSEYNEFMKILNSEWLIKHDKEGFLLELGKINPNSSYSKIKFLY